MNILNRLSKLEVKKSSDSKFCVCDPQHFEIFTQSFGDDAGHNDPVLMSQPTPDVCPVCRKPTERNRITVQIMGSKQIIMETKK